jgi:hypothetical protein
MCGLDGCNGLDLNRNPFGQSGHFRTSPCRRVALKERCLRFVDQLIGD